MPRIARTQLEKSLVGPAGEHYVLYRLYRQGMLASLAPPGSPTVDVLVMNPDETVIATLQVKTRTYGSGWAMNEKHEHFVQPRCFYALVDLEATPSVVYIVPSSVVADVLTKSHRAWLEAPGRQGQPHRDNKMRRIQAAYPHPWPGYQEGWLDEYRERWDLLNEAVSSDQ